MSYTLCAIKKIAHRWIFRFTVKVCFAKPCQPDHENRAECKAVRSNAVVRRREMMSTISVESTTRTWDARLRSVFRDVASSTTSPFRVAAEPSARALQTLPVPASTTESNAYLPDPGPVVSHSDEFLRRRKQKRTEGRLVHQRLQKVCGPSDRDHSDD